MRSVRSQVAVLGEVRGWEWAVTGVGGRVDVWTRGDSTVIAGWSPSSDDVLSYAVVDDVTLAGDQADRVRAALDAER